MRSFIAIVFIQKAIKRVDTQFMKIAAANSMRWGGLQSGLDKPG